MGRPKIFTFVPYDTDKHLEDSYNEFMSMIPDNAWGCFIDHDALFTTLDWYKQLQDVIVANPEYSCFTTMTNRIYNPKQILPDVDSQTHDIKYHRSIGLEVQKQSRTEVTDITKDTIRMSGVVILLKKSVWNKVKFRAWLDQKMYGVDYALHDDLNAAAFHIGIMRGVYVYHWYRELLPTLCKKADEAKVMIAMPLPKDYRVDFAAQRFCASTMRKGWHWLCYPSVEPSLARNLLVSTFLLDERFKNYTHLFFLDADTIPPFDTIEKLLAHDSDVACGVTPIYQNKGIYWNMQITKGKPTPADSLPDKLFEVDRIGGTTLLIKRKVLEALDYPYFQVLLSKSTEDTFKNGPMLLGHDYFFSDKVRKAGFKILVDPEIKCSHIRPIDVLDLL